MGVSLLWGLTIVWVVGLAEGWSDDLFFFTSFQNVSEWPEMYPLCAAPRNPPRHHLSPVALPDPSKLQTPPPHLSKQTLHIYNYPPPEKGSYFMSYTFPKGIECLYHKPYSPCYISHQMGQIRVPVLRTEWESSINIRDTYTIEEEEEYGSVITGDEDANEKFFYAAFFLGSADEEPSATRSTHTIDGKGYPMEIYMLFTDEELGVSQRAVVLVVLVEESKEDNPHVTPLVKTMRNHLVPEERQFLKDKIRVFQRERMFHHKKSPSCKKLPNCRKASDMFLSPAEEFKQHVSIMNVWQEYQTYETRIKFDRERLEKYNDLIRDNVAILAERNKDMNNRAKTIYWLVPSLARLLRFNPDFDHPDIRESLLVSRLKGEIWKEHVAPFPEVAKLEAEVMDPAVKEYLDWFTEFTCTRGTNLDQVQALQRWRNKEDSHPKTVKEVIESYRLGDNAHPFVKLLLALNRTIGGEPNLMILFKSDPNIPNPGANRRIQIFSGLISKYIRVMKQLRIFENGIEKIYNGFAMHMHDSGHPNVASFLKEMERVREERIAHFETVDDLDDVDTSDDFDGWEHQRKGRVEAGNLGMSEAQFADYMKLDSPKPMVTSKFQITWLIPKGGGYYMYKGNLPVPPCFRTEMTYVFKHPIKMSKSQIRALSTVPTSWMKERDIRSTFAPLHQPVYHVPMYSYPKGRSIPMEMYFEPRNHLTLGHDGVHRNSIVAAHERRMEKDKKKKTRKFGIYGGPRKAGSGGTPPLLLLLILPFIVGVMNYY